MRRQLEFLITEPEILAVVDLLLDRCTRFPGKGRGVFPGLPQGSPLSPLLANLALIPLDEALVDAGFPVVRYADDLVIALEEPRGRTRGPENNNKGVEGAENGTWSGENGSRIVL